MKQNILDFSVETDFQQRLLRRIKSECFSEISDDDLEYVNAAGVPAAEKDMIISLRIPDNAQ